MSIISVQDVQRDLIGFFRRIEAGETFLIVRDSHILAEVRPMPTQVTQARPFGLCAGQLKITADFDQPLPDEVLKEFEER